MGIRFAMAIAALMGCGVRFVDSSGTAGANPGTGGTPSSSAGSAGDAVTAGSMAQGGSGGAPQTGSGGSGGSGGSTTGGGQSMFPDIACGGQTCSGGDVCCVEPMPPGVSVVGCAADGSCGADKVGIGCDGPEDCTNGDVCCGEWTAADLLLQMGCKPLSGCQDLDDFLYCHTAPDCPSGQNCAASSIGPSYGYCE